MKRALQGILVLVLIVVISAFARHTGGSEASAEQVSNEVVSSFARGDDIVVVTRRGIVFIVNEDRDPTIRHHVLNMSFE